MGFPLGSFPTQVGLRGGAQGQWKIYSIYKKKNLKKIKPKRNLSESEIETADFTRFIVIESLKGVCPAKFSPFLIE